MNGSWKSTEEFTDYVTQTLLPDLVDSGQTSTANDFADAEEFIEMLVEQLDEQGDLIEKFILATKQARTYVDETEYHGMQCAGFVDAVLRKAISMLKED